MGDDLPVDCDNCNSLLGYAYYADVPGRGNLCVRCHREHVGQPDASGVVADAPCLDELAATADDCATCTRKLRELRERGKPTG